MAAALSGSAGRRPCRAPRRPLALAPALLAVAAGLLLSGLAGAIPTPPPGSGRAQFAEASRSRSVVLDEQSGQLKVVDGRAPEAVAWANLTNAIRETGWALLEVHTNGRFNDSLQAYAAGVVEASVSQELIYMHWMNTVVNYCGPFEYEVDYCEKLKRFLDINLVWMQEMMNLQEASVYWHQVQLILLQLKGLEDSYAGSVRFPTGKFFLKPLGFLLLQISGDLEDLEVALNKTRTQRVLGSGSCSALIKLLPGRRDLLVAHNTWSSYQHMLRVIKKYHFSFREGPREDSPLVPGNTLVFSSYPGTLFSCDDFYITNRQLVTLETTIGNRNPDLWRLVQPRGSVLEWLRSMVANRLAVDGPSWADIFKNFNSGTYNNQWMIVDYKAFVPGSDRPRGGLLTVLEQLPGMVLVADRTAQLYNETYWASYNIPAFETVFNASGLQDLVTLYGDWFSYDRNPRAQIFRRDHCTVQDVSSMLRLLRYNNYLHDPLSLCSNCTPQPNAENAISARSDLNQPNGSYPFQALQQRLHGGIDTKVTSMGLAQNLRMVAVSGPTWDQVPPFQWSTSAFGHLLHMGQPDLWKFMPVEVVWD
ncbi:putative phospholipase B-like 2 [Sorex fumeus]|uniref:putative phospholipase B-like 2 n=1 Tax=Sorex fumeus TaxID=62283 RepID=UPI0024ADA30C|nr:putative phospholipase B-like 2 [Sorex fumeus]